MTWCALDNLLTWETEVYKSNVRVIGNTTVRKAMSLHWPYQCIWFVANIGKKPNQECSVNLKSGAKRIRDVLQLFNNIVAYLENVPNGWGKGGNRQVGAMPHLYKRKHEEYLNLWIWVTFSWNHFIGICQTGLFDSPLPMQHCQSFPILAKILL